MNEEFIRSHNFEEELLPTGIETIISPDQNKILEFEAKLKEELPHCRSMREVAQVIVMASIEIEGLQVKDPEIIVDALLQNKEKYDEAKALAERIMKKNLQ